MANHYGNFIVDGILGIGEEISGGYIFPTTIGASAEVLLVTVDPFGDKHLQFKNLRNAPYNFVTKDDVVTDLSGAPKYITQLLDITNDFTGNKDKVLTVDVSETTASFKDPRGNFEHIVQASHGFAVGDAIYRSISGSYELALADVNNPDKAEVIGVVEEVIGLNEFRLVYSGKIKNLTGLVDGEVYFLSNSLPGKMTTTRYSINSIIKPVMVATSTTEAIVVNYVGFSSIVDVLANDNQFVVDTADISGNATLDADNHYVRVDTSLGDVTITLPSVAFNQQRIYKIKKISSDNRVILMPGYLETIDNLPQYVLENKDSVEIIAGSSTNWDVNYISRYNVRLITANSTLLSSDKTVHISGASAVIVPNATTHSNEFTLKNLGSNNAVICGVNLIENATYQNIYPNETFTLYSDGTNWWVK